MAEERGVAILVGAGDAIGAAVARRFAAAATPSASAGATQPSRRRWSMN